MREVIILIPSRLKSRRLKNKPLLKIDGLPLVLHTYKRASMSKLAPEHLYHPREERILLLF